MPKPSASSTPQSSTLLEDLRDLERRVASRVRELEPFEAELHELRLTAERLGIDLREPVGRRRTVSTKSVAADGATRRSARAAKVKAAPRLRRRRSGTGESRADQVARLVEQQPGITVPALGEAMKVDSTGLYRVIRQLEVEGRLRKDGRQLQPVAPASSPEPVAAGTGGD